MQPLIRGRSCGRKQNAALMNGGTPLTTRKTSKTRLLAQFSILLALEAIFCFTPLGSIPIGPIVATLAMIPVVITGMSLGTKWGALMGFFAGLFSFLVWTFAPPFAPTAFVFTPFVQIGEVSGNFFSVLICFVPRVLIGVVSGLCCAGFTKKFPKADLLRFGVSGLLGSLTNTVLVLGGIWIFFGDAYATILSASVSPEQAATFGGIINAIIMVTVLTNGIPEAIVTFFAGYAVCKALDRYRARGG